MPHESYESRLSAIYNDGYLAALNNVGRMIQTEKDAHHSLGHRAEVTALLDVWGKVHALAPKPGLQTEGSHD
ncbi:hypothetical protein [Corynebacterium glyciniphilum]|uniref:hypothetical protein n=1 Tax=Corynebacterium glyciniphilum TaxID=1404244 RepID=UPI002654CABC|nr:hypothetical protein [Corynebacterium glyciniphilum]MDN6706413.1 hypothetical protein [Corynebacterium glyciniphilum]